MWRKFTVLTVGLVVVAMLGVVSIEPAVAKPIKMILSHGYPTGTKARPYLIHQWSVILKKNIEKFTDGRVKVTIYPVGQLFKAKEVLDALARNDVQISVLNTMYTALYVKWHGAGTFLPLKNEEGAWRLFRDKRFFELNDRDFSKLGVKWIGIGPYNFVGKVLWTQKPIEKIADMKGVKLRAHTVEQPLWKKLGGSGVLISASEVMGSISRGTVNGCTMTESWGLTNKLYKYCPYAAEYGYGGWGIPFMISMKQWKKLPKDIQDIIQTKVLTTSQDEYLAWGVAEQIKERAGIKKGGGKYGKPLPELEGYMEKFEEWKNEISADWGITKEVKLCSDLIDGKI